MAFFFSENSDSQNDNTVRPYFEEPLHSISVKPGDDAVFKCSARGTPAPVFKWYFSIRLTLWIEYFT